MKHNKAMQLTAKSAGRFSSFVVYGNNLDNSTSGGTNFLHQLIAGRYNNINYEMDN